MKNLNLILLILGGIFLTYGTETNVYAASRNIEFWCTPDNPYQGIEAVLVTTTAGQINLEIYTKAARWGSVNVKTLSAELVTPTDADGPKYSYKSLNKSTELTLYHEEIPPYNSGTVFDSIFTQKSIDLKMYCEYLP